MEEISLSEQLKKIAVEANKKKLQIELDKLNAEMAQQREQQIEMEKNIALWYSNAMQTIREVMFQAASIGDTSVEIDLDMMFSEIPSDLLTVDIISKELTAMFNDPGLTIEDAVDYDDLERVRYILIISWS